MLDSERLEFTSKYDILMSSVKIKSYVNSSSQRSIIQHQEIELSSKKIQEFPKEKSHQENLLEIIEIQRQEIEKLYKRIIFLENQFEKTKNKPNDGLSFVIGHDKYFKGQVQDQSNISLRNELYPINSNSEGSSV